MFIILNFDSNFQFIKLNDFFINQLFINLNLKITIIQFVNLSFIINLFISINFDLNFRFVSLSVIFQI